MLKNRVGTALGWDKQAEDHLFTILEQIPMMIRGIAETRVTKKAQALAIAEGRQEISHKDMVDAFFAETPSGFVPAMKQSMAELGIDYGKYGHK
jgi:hypothetical protein